MLRAVLFDFNGVLVDDEPLHLRLIQRVLEEEGVAALPGGGVLAPPRRPRRPGRLPRAARRRRRAPGRAASDAPDRPQGRATTRRRSAATATRSSLAPRTWCAAWRRPRGSSPRRGERRAARRGGGSPRPGGAAGAPSRSLVDRARTWRRASRTRRATGGRSKDSTACRPPRPPAPPHEVLAIEDTRPGSRPPVPPGWRRSPWPTPTRPRSWATPTGWSPHRRPDGRGPAGDPGRRPRPCSKADQTIATRPAKPSSYPWKWQRISSGYFQQ